LCCKYENNRCSLKERILKCSTNHVQWLALYVEQTGRQLKTRIAEPQYSLKYIYPFCNYRTLHDFDWNNIQILNEEPCYDKFNLLNFWDVNKSRKTICIFKQTQRIFTKCIYLLQNLTLFLSSLLIVPQSTMPLT